MKERFVYLCAVLTLAGVALAQQANTSNDAQVSSNSSISASKSGASVQSDNSARVSTQASATTPLHQEAREKKSKHDSAKHEKTANPEASSSLAAGSAINAVLAKPLDSRKCKPGDKVEGTVAQDVKSDGKVVLHKGTKLIGHVTEAKAKSKGEANSSLGIVFDHAILKQGQEVPIHGVVQAIAAAQMSNAASLGDDGMSEMGGGNAMAGGTARSGSGLLGGVTSTAGAATGAVVNTAAGATGAAASTLGATTNVGNGLAGSLNSNSTGVVGLKDLSLSSDLSNATQGSVITSTGKSVHLDSGTQMLLRVVK
jgi:hypothetical protein